ncbi:MAG: ankyrin repeat domain-containing protein, partial [Betaproteobacteria bacterium]
MLIAVLAIAATGGKASAAVLSAADETQLREAHAAEKVFTGESNKIRGEAMQLARKLGQKNDVGTAVFFLELGDRSMFYAFVESWKAPATPELEVQVIKHLHDAELHTCSSALLLRQYVLRVTYDALLDAIRERPGNAEYCVRAVVRTELPGIEADLTALLPLLEDYYSQSAIATFLVERKYEPAERALIAWLLRSSDRSAGTVGWIIVKLDTPGMVDALARRMAMLKRAPANAEIDSSVAALTGAILYATPQVKMNASLLPPEVVEQFSPASRSKIVAMLKRRSELEGMSDDPNTANLAYWISQHKNERVKAFIAAGVDLGALGKSSGDRPLHVAVKYGNLEALRLLLAAGADPNRRDWMGNTPLKELAGRKAYDDSLDATNLTAAKMLLAKGADPSLPSKDTMTPLHLATA